LDLMNGQNILCYQLDNGLKVLLDPVYSAPVVSHWVWYRVGARNEIPGKTGISHWVEHMMFKGTVTYPKGSIFKAVNVNGGTLNGFTGQDYTAYYETLPADRLDLALRIECDRMANSIIEPAEVEAERTVIIAEREGSENSPNYLLYEEVVAAAFKVHPYGHPVIGWKEDLLNITRDDLWQHYKTYYGPHNAIIVIAGDIDAETVQTRINDLYDPLPTGPSPPPVTITEPLQLGMRRVYVKRSGTVPYFQAVYHTPPGSHIDNYPLTILDFILSGASPMGLMGGGTRTHRSARLYKAMVETQIATRAGSNYKPSLDTGTFYLSGTPARGRMLQELEDTFFSEIEKLAQTPVPEAEIARVIKQAKAQYAYALERVSNRAYWLGLMEIMGDWRKFLSFLDNLSTVTPDDVQRVAQSYLQPTNCTVGWFEPENG
jgi:zinc protease